MSIEAFEQLVGRWSTEGAHRLMPDVVIRGTTTFEWLDGKKFLIVRAQTDHPDIPDSISIIGDTDGLTMHYFDSRGVYRIMKTAMTDRGWEWSRDHPRFSQRFVGRFEDDGNTILAMAQLSEDDETWVDDLRTTYRRVP